jgi:hypothetical protein
MVAAHIGWSRTGIADQPQSYKMYRKPRFLEMLHAIREEMSREADYDTDLFAEMVRSGVQPAAGPERNIRGFRSRAPRDPQETPRRKDGGSGIVK